MTVPRRASRPDGGNPAPVLDSRAVCYVGILLLAGYGVILASQMADGYTLFGHRELARYDFSVFWGAGRLAAAGRATAVYDWQAIHQVLNSLLGTPSQPYVGTFYYPPWFLLVLAPLGSLPFAVASAIWLVATLAVYLAAVRAILPGGTALIAALAAPTVFFNWTTGQDGLLTAALFGGALVTLDAAPMAAGLLIGLIAYKPHFGLLLPLFLALTGRWRVFAGATAAVTCLAAAAAALFGAATFAALLRAVPTAGDAYLQHAAFSSANWSDLASFYGLLRVVGVGSGGAWCGHLAIALAAAAAALWVAAGDARSDLKSPALATAAVIVTPYSELNDLAILTVAIAFLVRDGLSQGMRRPEGAALAAALLMPLLYLLWIPIAGPVRENVTWVVGPLMCAILAGVITARAVAVPGIRLRRRIGAMPVAPARPIG